MAEAVLTPLAQLIELRHGRPLRQLLPELYVQHGSIAAVARALGVSTHALEGWLAVLGLHASDLGQPRRRHRARLSSRIGKVVLLEMKHGRSFAQLLAESYAEHGSICSAAKALGVSRPIIWRWMRARNLRGRDLPRLAEQFSAAKEAVKT